MLDRFFAVNRGLCARIERYLPQAKTDVFGLYEATVARYMNSKRDQIVVDVGGGKSCPFAKYREPGSGTKIIAVDVSEEELRQNRDVDERRTADIMRNLPFGDGEVDLVVSRSVLEHLQDLDNFVANSRRVLKRGGYSIHLFPSKFAPFALINQALPNKLSNKVVHFFLPESKGICGFPAFYDKCYYSAINSLLARHGFEVVHLRPSYYQSPYFRFFAPAFVASALYEMLVQALGMMNLCAYILIVARKV